MIELENVCAGYNGKTVIKNISLKFPMGKLISVIGPNGAGKTTLLKAVAGLLPVSDGKIIIDGTNRAAMNRRETARKIAYLAQGRSTPDMTAGQLALHGRFPHLGYPRTYSESDRHIASDALAHMGISDHAATPLSELSGGMRQNAFIAMALAQDTDYILLDEPTTYLDISNQLGVIKTLRSLANDGKGIVSVIHDLPLAFTFSDIIAVVVDGSILLQDTPEKVFESNVIKSVFGAELSFCTNGKFYYYNMF